MYKSTHNFNCRGGGCNKYHNAAGGGGGSAYANINVTGGSSISVTVGNGGFDRQDDEVGQYNNAGTGEDSNVKYNGLNMYVNGGRGGGLNPTYDEEYFLISYNVFGGAGGTGAADVGGPGRYEGFVSYQGGTGLIEYTFTGGGDNGFKNLGKKNDGIQNLLVGKGSPRLGSNAQSGYVRLYFCI